TTGRPVGIDRVYARLLMSKSPALVRSNVPMPLSLGKPTTSCCDPRTTSGHFQLQEGCMKRLISAVAGLALVTAACEDFNTPSDQSAEAPPTEAAPQLDSAQVQATASAHIWAVVDQNGNLIHGNRTTGVVKLGPGQYEVSFNRNLTSCAYVATTRNAYSQAIQASTAGGHLSANGVYVETKNQGGGLTDGPFDLVVTCGGTGIRYAVVGYSADLVRSTAGTTLTFLGAGGYNIRFASSVAGCSYIATLADPGNALVYSPSGVYTGSGPDANTVYIETKNPGGGLQDGVPFHLALICPTTTNARLAGVKASGIAQRASAGTSSSRPSTGNYIVANNRNIGACATIATRGSVNTGVPFSPATIEITPG